eukprot:CAMPEP_0178970960 /NCGR_PEP_ID=MMETSP0789-20121207/19936_1 /TAXON_ID=3005 /ORGANISM="Rhizosolenia setigera, Strain CCMP 1694" /LENGTH=930 /DNA_ID=CAMNT_0020657731 /DNA_START=36 /DNA_END=2825 /DNA_ORIENTATION=-
MSQFSTAIYKVLIQRRVLSANRRIPSIFTSSSLKNNFHQTSCPHTQPTHVSNSRISVQQHRFFYASQQPIEKPSIKHFSSSASSTPSVLERAKSILQELEKQNSDGDDSISVNNQTDKNNKSFRTLINLTEVSALVDKLSKINAQVNKNDVTSPSSHISTESSSAKHHTSSIEASELAHSIQKQLEIYLEQKQQKKIFVNPSTAYIYSHVLNCFAKSGGGRYAAEKAESIFLDMLEKKIEEAKKNVKEISIIYLLNPTLDAWAHSCVFDAGLRAQELLEKVRNSGIENGVTIESPDLQSYNIILNAWASSGNPEATDYVMDIFDEMISASSELNKELYPDKATFGIILKAWALSMKGEEAALRAESILKKMENSMLGLSSPTLSTENFQYPSPDTTAYNLVLDAWSRSKSKHAENRVEEIMTRMLRLYQDGYQQTKPNSISFTSSISTIARSTFSSGKSSPGHRAERLLHRMKEMYLQTGDIDLAPTVLTYGAVLDAWAKSSYRGNDSAEKAEKLLNQLIQEAQEQYENTADNCGKSSQHIHVNTTCFNSVLSAWAKSGHADAGLKAQELLNRLESYASIYSSCPDSERDKHFARDCIPDIISYTSVINAYANTGSAIKAEEILDRLEQQETNNVRPNTYTYSSVISAWAKSRKPDAGRRAEAVLRRMMDLDDPDIQPNIVTFSSVIDAHAKSRERGSAARAEAILDHMEDQFESFDPSTSKSKGKSTSGEITSISKIKSHKILTAYNSVIDAWAKSRDIDAAKRANQVLERLERKPNVQPDIISYSSALNACAKTRGSLKDKQKAYKLAIKILNRMESTNNSDESGDRKKVKPNSITYNVLIELVGNLMSSKIQTQQKKRTKKLETIFVKCCEDGYLNDFILTTFRRNANQESFHKMVVTNLIKDLKDDESRSYQELNDISVSDLPPEW